MSGNGKQEARRRPTSKRRSSLRFETLNAFVDTGARHLSPSGQAVWLVLFRDTKQNGLARTAVDDIAERTGLGRRTVLRSLKALASKRMLQTMRRGGLNRGPSSYRIFPFPVPEDWG
jgi:hypothetical protein